MGGLCGWLGGIAETEAPTRLEAMTATLADWAPAAERRQAGRATAAGGLALKGFAAESHWCEEDGLLVALLGYPRWTDEALTALAARKGPAAALAEAYRRHGRDLLERLLGHFVFVLLEPAKGRAFAAIDRFGVYRLCYARPAGGSTLAFATSADAIRTWPGLGATIHPQTLYQYLYFIDRVAAPGTIYQEQQKLRPGEALWCEAGRLQVWRYWQLDYRQPSKGPKSDLHGELRRRLESAVTTSLTGEAPAKAAAFLSGGLDSSTVTGFLAQAGRGAGLAVSIGFREPDFDETRYAKAAAQAFGLRHEIYVVGPDEVLAVLPQISQAYDEPYSNSSVIPSYYCAKVGRDLGAQVMLAGDGGDELFGGNTRYLKDDVFDHYRKAPAWLRGLAHTLLGRLPGRQSSRLLRRAQNYVALAQRSPADRLTGHNAFAELALDEVFAAGVLPQLDAAGPRRFAEGLYDEALADAKIQKMMHLDLQLTLADSDLRKVLTAAQLAGMRVRFPCWTTNSPASPGGCRPAFSPRAARSGASTRRPSPASCHKASSTSRSRASVCRCFTTSRRPRRSPPSSAMR